MAADAVPRIVWRNPKIVKRVRAWTHVRQGNQRSLYLILESSVCGPASWEGLPTLEIARGRKGDSGQPKGSWRRSS